MVRRNIQVGDDLSGKTLYFSFPDNLYDDLFNETVVPYWVTVIETSKSYDNKISDEYAPSSSMIYQRVHVTVDLNNWIYSAERENSGDWTVTKNEPTFTLPDDFGIVTSVNKDAVSYPYIFIEVDEIENLNINNKTVESMKINNKNVIGARINNKQIF